MKLRWLRGALDALKRRAKHLALENPGAAVEAVDRLMTQAEALREAPETGRLVRRGLRELAIAETPFALIYRVNRKSERVEILHVADGAPLQPQPTERQQAIAP